jgi:hypothetical protein
MNILSPISLLFVFVFGSVALMGTHELIHGTFCESYNGKASYGANEDGLFTKCELSRSEPGIENLVLLNSLNELIGYNLLAVWMIVSLILIRYEYLKMEREFYG